MNLVVASPENTPEARRKRRNVWLAYAFGLLLGALASSVAQALAHGNPSPARIMANLPAGSQGLLAGAAIALLFACIPGNRRLSIVVEEGRLSVRSGDTVKWQARLAELEDVRLARQRKKYGFVHSPASLLLSKRGGDSFSLPRAAFRDEDLERLIRELEPALGDREASLGQRQP